MDSNDIRGYWNYLPFVYGLKSRLSSVELATKLRPFFPGGNFVITEINPWNVNGVMPQAAWSWFYQNPDETPTKGLTLGEILALGAPKKD